MEAMLQESTKRTLGESTDVSQSSLMSKRGLKEIKIFELSREKNKENMQQNNFRKNFDTLETLSVSSIEPSSRNGEIKISDYGQVFTNRVDLLQQIEKLDSSGDSSFAINKLGNSQLNGLRKRLNDSLVNFFLLEESSMEEESQKRKQGKIRE